MGMRVSGDIDLSTTDSLVATASEHLTPGGEMVLDCSGITFLDSCGLRGLLEIGCRAAAADVALLLAEPSDCVLRVVELSGTYDLFRISGALVGAASPVGVRLFGRHHQDLVAPVVPGPFGVPEERLLLRLLQRLELGQGAVELDPVGGRRDTLGRNHPSRLVVLGLDHEPCHGVALRVPDHERDGSAQRAAAPHVLPHGELADVLHAPSSRFGYPYRIGANPD
jgi:stage II sporulation protein AA (anti-sigma F factor antagonist)